MAGKPNLVGKIIGLRKYDKLDWALEFRVTNTGDAPSPAFKVRLDLYKDVSPGIVEIFWYCVRTLNPPKKFGSKLNPQSNVQAAWLLPVGVKHTDVGPKVKFAFTIEGPPDESNTDDNKIFSDEPPEILPPFEQPTPPPDPWRMTASAVIGKFDRVVAHIINPGSERLAASTIQLHVRTPKPGAPTGSPKIAGTAPVPSLQPSEEVLVTVVGNREFIVPKTRPAQPGGVKKNLTRKFTTLIPFSLKIQGAGSEIGFGPILGNPEGKIKFPGKK